MPSWSPDGTQVYFVRTVNEIGTWPSQGKTAHYLMTVPSVMAINADGSGQAERIINGKIQQGQPRVVRTGSASRCPRPNGKTLALVSDAPDPTKSDVDPPDRTTSRGRSRPSPTSPRSRRWATRTRRGSRTARRCCTSATRRDGAKGAPAIYRYDLKTKKGAAADRPGLPRAELLAGRALHRRDQDRHVRLRHRHPRRVARTRAPARHQRRRVVGAGLVAEGRRDRVPPHRGPDRGPADGRPRRERAGLDGHRDQGPDRGLRPRRRVPARLVHPGERAAGPDAGADPGRDPERRPPARARRPSDRHATSSDWPRGRPRPGPSCASASTRTRRRCPTGSRATSRASSGSRRWSSRRRRRMPPRSSRTSRSSRRSGRPGWPPSSGSAAASRRDLPVVADAKRGDIGSTAARQAVALFDGLGADAVTVNPYLGAEAIAPLIERPDRFAYVLCRTSNPGAGELQDLVVAADPDAGFPAEPLHRRVARRAATWGPGGTVGLVVGGTAPAELAGIRSIVPGPGVPRPRRGRPGRRGGRGPRARPRERGPGRRASRRRPAGERVAGASRARRRRPATGVRRIPWSGSRQPPPSGLESSLCYPSPRTGRSPRLVPTRRGAHSIRPSQEHDDAEHRSPGAHHHPGHRAAGPRPGQASRGRQVDRPEHQANSARRRPTSRKA